MLAPVTVNAEWVPLFKSFKRLWKVFGTLCQETADDGIGAEENPLKNELIAWQADDVDTSKNDELEWWIRMIRMNYLRK